MKDQQTPFNTGKVQIGSKYMPPKPYEMTLFEEDLQRALLSHGKKPHRPLSDYLRSLIPLAAAIVAVSGVLYLMAH